MRSHRLVKHVTTCVCVCLCICVCVCVCVCVRMCKHDLLSIGSNCSNFCSKAHILSILLISEGTLKALQMICSTQYFLITSRMTISFTVNDGCFFKNQHIWNQQKILVLQRAIECIN